MQPFREVQRAIAHRRETRRQARLKEVEKARRLSVSRQKRFEEHRGVELEFLGQIGAERTAYREAREALKERREAERELRRAHWPQYGEAARRAVSMARATGRGAVRAARAMSKPGALEKTVIGDTSVMFGKPRSEEGLHEVIFGKRAPKASKERKTGLGLLDIDKDVLG